MPAVIRQGVDSSSGHCYVPTPPASGSANVFTNNIPSVRATPSSEGASGPDSYPDHTCPPIPDTHGMGNAAKGSPNVFVNFQAFHRNGDAIDCGDTASNGSPNVFANSSQSPGIIDNNPTFAALSDNDSFAEDINTTALAQLPNLTPADKHLTENFDTKEDEDEGLSGGTPPGTTPSDKETTVEEVDEEAPPPETPPTQDCSTVSSLPSNFTWSTDYGSFDEFARSFRLSPNYTVADLTINPVFRHRFSASVTQPAGLTQKQILLNMCHHANTVLEPMRSMYPGFIITSGWRSASGRSQHNKGQATDLQWPSKNGSGAARNYYELAQEIRDTQSYDQLILEWGNNPWIHISSNPGSHRKSVLTQRGSGSSTFVPGLHLIG